MEPTDPPVGIQIRPPPYLPHPHHNNMAYIPTELPVTPPTPPLPNGRHIFLPPDDPPPPYDAIIKDAVVLAPTSRMASQWLQPSTSV